MLFLLLPTLLLASQWGPLRAADVGFSSVYPCIESSAAFDSLGLQCNPCGDEEEVSSDGTECLCPSGYLRSSTAGRQPPTSSCTACEEATSFTGLYCVLCDDLAGATTDTFAAASLNSAGLCECDGNPPGGLIIEMDGRGVPYQNAAGQRVQRCLICPAGTVPNQAEGTCDSCEYPKALDDTGSCVCPETLPVGAVCRDAGALERMMDELDVSSSNPFEATFEDVLGADGSSSTVVVSESGALSRHLETALAGCYDRGEGPACSSLGNLCVLAMYDPAAPACRLYDALQEARDGVQYHEDEIMPLVGWSVSLPWLHYPAAIDTEDFLLATDVHTRLTLGSPAPDASPPVANRLDLVASVTSLNGTWLGFQPLTTQFQLCGAARGRADKWREIGYNYANECEIELEWLVEAAAADTTLFYDLYLRDGPERLYPVPVVLANHRGEGGAAVNEDEDSPGALTRRFYLADALYGTEEGQTGGRVLTYAASMKLVVQMQDGATNAMLPPRLLLSYAAVREGEAPPARAGFRVAYLGSNSARRSFWEAWDVLLIIFLVTGLLVWLVSTYAFLRRRRNEQLDLSLMLTAVVNAAAVGSQALFLVGLLLALYSLVFFKGQAEVHTILMRNAALKDFRVMIYVALSASALAVAALVYQQLHYDVFFVDWEKHRRVLASGGASEEAAPVSCWRQLFVANKWNELQGARLTAPWVTMFVLVAVLSGWGVEDVAYNHPDVDAAACAQMAERSDLLSFGLSASVFLAVALAQIVLRKTLYHSLIEHPLESFTDLLFLANISLVALDDKYCGYYVHGRNQLQHSDTGLSELNDSLMAETKGLVANRGLLAGAAAGASAQAESNQVFTVFISPEFRAEYDRLHVLIQEAFVKDRIARGRLQAVFGGPGKQACALMEARAEVERKFKDLIQQVEQNHAIQVADPPLLQRVVQMPPVGSENKSIFLHDYYNSFSGVTFYNSRAELRLLVFEILFFCTIDWGLANAALSASITYGVILAVRWVRTHFGTNNIARKSLVDRHFLV